MSANETSAVRLSMRAVSASLYRTLEKNSKTMDEYPVATINNTGKIPPWKIKEIASKSVEKAISFHWNFNANHNPIFCEDFGVTMKRAFFPKIPFVADTNEVVSIDPYSIMTATV